MTIRVGIPRALFFYHYYPLWRAFFESLGAECVVSPRTHRGILQAGSVRVTGENCLPLKIYLGHVASLAGDVDYVFVPLIRSLGAEEENCARLRGLPDVVRALVPEAPKILAPEVDLQLGPGKMTAAIVDVGRHFTRNPLRISRAVAQAQKEQRSYEKLLSSGLTMPAALSRLEQQADEASGVCADQDMKDGPDQPLRVALLGHAYNLYDDYVNHRLLERLRSMGVAVVTPDAVPMATVCQSMSDMKWKRYWTYEHELVGSAAFYLTQNRIDGMIGVVTFGCGPDAVMLATLQDFSRRFEVPLLNLVLDEHSGEAGLITRIEAYVDMLERRRTPKAGNESLRQNVAGGRGD